METTDHTGLYAKVEETLVIAKENNKLIKAMRRDAMIGAAVQFVFWVVVIIGSFYLSAKFIEPYLAAFQGGGEGGTIDYGALLKDYQGLLGQ